MGDYQCPLGLGTQTIGSTIRPGSFNGIFAMKPTWNAVSREGLKMLAASLDTLGLYGRSVEDLMLLLDAFRVYDDEPVEEKPMSSLKIAVCKTSIWETGIVTPSLEAVWNQAAELLSKAGATVEVLELPESFNEAYNSARNVMWTEAKSAFLNEYLSAPDKCHDDFKIHVENRRKLNRGDQLQAYDLLNRLKPEFDSIAKEYDVSEQNGYD